MNAILLSAVLVASPPTADKPQFTEGQRQIMCAARHKNEAGKMVPLADAHQLPCKSSKRRIKVK